MQREIFDVQLEVTPWTLWGIQLGHRLRLHAEPPTGDENRDQYMTYWNLQLPLGLAIGIHPPSLLVTWFRKLVS